MRPLLVGTGVGMLLLFAWWERRAADPVVDLRLLTRRAFAAGSLIIGLQNFAMYALLFELPLVFARGFGATSAQTGRALLGMTLAMGNGLPAVYVECTDPPPPSLEPSRAWVRAHGIPRLELPTGHDAMVTAPMLVCDLLGAY